MGEPRYVEVPLSTGKKVQVKVKTLHQDDNVLSERLRAIAQIERWCAIQECALQGIPFDAPSGLVVLQERFDALKARYARKHRAKKQTDEQLGELIQSDPGYSAELAALDTDYRQAVKDNQSKPPVLSTLTTDAVGKAIGTIEGVRSKAVEHRREVIGLLLTGKHGEEEIKEVVNTCTANDYYLMQTASQRPDLLPKLLSA